MNVINGSKSFYRYMKRDVIDRHTFMLMILNIDLSKRLFSVFEENNNGNINIFDDFYKKSNQSLQIQRT